MNRALLHLANGEPHEAIALLKTALEQGEDSPSLWSDLATAYIEAARDSPGLLGPAAGSALRAIELDPGLPEARFNLALALQRLHLREPTRRAWRDFLAVDPVSPWARDASEELARLEEPTAAEAWQIERPQLVAAAASGDHATARAIIARHPQEAREYGQEVLLGNWARHQASGRVNQASATLGAARAFGEALDSFHGDRLLAASVEVIGRATGESHDRLVSGHLAFADGLALSVGDRFAEAAPRLLAALRDLAAVGSPFAGWAEFHLARGAYQRSEYEEATAGFRRVVERSRDFPSLRARALWLLGTIASVQGDSAGAIEFYRESRGLYAALGETRNRLALDTNLAVTLDDLGDDEESWQYRIAALEALAEMDDPLRIRATLGEAALVMARSEPAAALILQDEIVRIVMGRNDPTAESAALRRRAAILHRLGRHDEALIDVGTAELRAAEIADPEALRTALGETAAVAGVLWRAVDSEQALRAFDHAIERFESSGYSALVPGLLLERARIRLAHGEEGMAEADLEATIAEHEHRRGRISDPWARILYLDRVADSFDELVRLRLSRGDEVGAFDAGERGRARATLDWISGSKAPAPYIPAARVLTWAEIAPQLPSGLAVVAYTVLAESSVAWVLSEGKLTTQWLRPGEAELTALAEALAEAAQTADDEQFRRKAARLYELLVAPIRPLLPAGTRLVVVPDEPLGRVPFSALIEPGGRYILEDYLISSAPSVNILLRTLERDRSRNWSSAPSVLVVSDPAFDQRLFPELRRLPAAIAEGVKIAALYGDSTVLVGTGATLENLLRHLPEHEIIHVGAHALTHGRGIWTSSLVLASSREKSTGYLTLAELSRLNLERAPIVVLAACGSGAVQDSHTEGAFSLATPFLIAGSSSVIVSLWTIEDRVAARFSEQFHAYMGPDFDAVKALRRVQLEFVSGRNSLASPRIWAAFEAIGASVPR